MISIQVVEDCFDINLFIKPKWFSDTECFNLIMWIDKNDPCIKVFNSIDNTDYLEEIQNILNYLNNQFLLYYDFIQDLTVHIHKSCGFLINLNSYKMYIKGNHGNNKVVITPVLEMRKDEEYATMHIDNIDGNYPMKIYTTIDTEDLLKILDFFL